METLWQIEIAMIQMMQSAGLHLMGLWSGVTVLGSEEFFILIMPALYWSIDSAVGLKTGVILMLSTVFNGFFKVMLHSPRPFWFSNSIAAYSSEASFGMPSGHAMNTITVWGFLASSFRQTWLTILAVVVIVLVGVSRIFLGMHFISDVLIGWLLGFILLILFLKFEPGITASIKKMTLAQHLGLAIASSLGLIALSCIPLVFLQNWQIPSIWLENAVRAIPGVLPNPLDQSGTITGAGLWLGLCAGAAWIHSRGGYSAKGVGFQLFLRYLIGVIGVAILWFGLKLIVPQTTDVFGFGFRYLRYAIVGCWISGFAPAIFIRYKLAFPMSPANMISKEQ